MEVELSLSLLCLSFLSFSVLPSWLPGWLAGWLAGWLSLYLSLCLSTSLSLALFSSPGFIMTISLSNIRPPWFSSASSFFFRSSSASSRRLRASSSSFLVASRENRFLVRVDHLELGPCGGPAQVRFNYRSSRKNTLVVYS